MLWHTNMAADNPHSIELMPNGVIAIASSTGGEVRFFTTDQESSTACSASVALEDAHGVLWDEEKEVLWAVGRNVLAAYRVELTADGGVAETEESDLRAAISSDHAHDLAPVYGNQDALWITTGSHVYQFNKTKRTFTTGYKGGILLNRSGVKGVGSFDDGSIVYIYPDGWFKSWTSRSAYLLNASNGMRVEILKSDEGHFYKIRVWDTRYQ